MHAAIHSTAYIKHLLPMVRWNNAVAVKSNGTEFISQSENYDKNEWYQQ